MSEAKGTIDGVEFTATDVQFAATESQSKFVGRMVGQTVPFEFTFEDITPDKRALDSLVAASSRYFDQTLARSVSYLDIKHPPRLDSGELELRGLRIELQQARFSDEGLRLRVVVPDRNTGSPMALVFDVGFPVAATIETIADYLEQAIAKVIAHEIAELLLVRGRRRDPHLRGM